MDPLLIEVPETLETERWMLRRPRPGDGAALNAAILDSLDELRPWAAWIKTVPSVDDSESYVRRAHAQFAMRSQLVFHIRERGDADGPMLGVVALARMNWDIPRFEIGYWRRSGYGQRGLMTEAVIGLSAMAFDALNAERVELRMDDKNVRSWRVAERAGFTLDGVMRREGRSVTGVLSDTRIYSRLRGDLPNFASGVERTAIR